MKVDVTRKALDAVRPATETLAALQASVRDRTAAVVALRTKAEEGAKAQQLLCERLATAEAGLQGAEQEPESAVAAEADRARARQAAPDPEAEAVEERVQQIASDPQAIAAAIAELDQMKGRLLAASGQTLSSVPVGTEALKAEVSSPKRPRFPLSTSCWHQAPRGNCREGQAWRACRYPQARMEQPPKARSTCCDWGMH